MTKKGSDTSEQRCVWLLNQRGFAFWREDALEEKIKVRTRRPDFYVETPEYGPFLAEVESFKKPGPFKSLEARVMASDPEQIFRRIRTAVQHASEQLSPYKSLSIPMLVVLDNWRRVGIPSSVLDLRNALFGKLEVRKPFDPTGTSHAPARWHHGKGQLLNTIQRNYISAVAWNLPKVRYHDDPMTQERPMRLRMVHNPFADVPFPIEIFNNGDDERWGYRAGRWINFLST
jgi:hypothetical protein